MKDAFTKGGNKVEVHDYYKYRISYITENELNLMFLFVTGLTDNFDNIKKELIKCKKEFLNLFEDILKHKFDSKTFEVFDPTIDSIHRNLRPKISLVGFSGVGKTTITRLIKAEEIPMQHIPTITGDIATIKIGKLHFHLWDFAGQEQFSYLWNNFIKGSDAVLLITDSSLENVEKSKFFLELIKEQAPQAHTAIIGNKQDLDEAMKPEQIEKILGLKSYSMIAKDPGNRDKMIQIVADILEMSSEVSPLLKPLLDRDTYTEEATRALENADFEKAANLFEKISDLCIELGDDSLGREFYEKGQKIKSMLQKTAPTKVPKETREKEEKEKPSPKPDKEPEELTPIPTPPKVAEKVVSEEKKELPKKPAMPRPPELTPVPEIAKKIEITPKAESTPTAPKVQKIEPFPTEQPTFKKINEIEKVDKLEPKTIDQPKGDQEKVGLNLNPEDFMIKERPKTVTVVPKDAKNKLKTSPFAQVTNPMASKPPIPISPAQVSKKPETQKIPDQANKITAPLGFQDFKKPTTTVPSTKPLKPKIQDIPIEPSKPPVPIDPKELMKPQAPEPGQKKSILTPPTKPPEVVKPTIDDKVVKSPAIESQQKAAIEKSLLDLKIKKSNISKMALDFDMKELTGEITVEELDEKKNKLKVIEVEIDKQIKELKELLDS